MHNLINMKKIIILLLLFCVIPFASFSQKDIRDSLSTVNSQKQNTVSPLSKKKAKVSKKSQSVEFSQDVMHAATIDSLQKTIDSLQNKIQELTLSINDFSNTSMALKINEYKKKIDRLENKLVFADTIIARLSNDCLCKKYDATNVASAIYNFKQMYSPELKSQLGRLIVLLNEYGKYTQEIETIFIEAQNDKDIRNPFIAREKALTYIDKIKATTYYREVYGDNWTIPYLNSVIDKSIEIIRSFNPRESKELHLMELMK